MATRKSIASVLLFVGSTLCFFLPFATVSCGGEKAFTLTGQQMATGTTLREPGAMGSSQTQKIDADPFAALAWLSAFAGVALSLAGRRMGAGSAAFGGVGAVMLLVLRSRLDEQIKKQGMGMAQVSYETGFTLALLLLIAGAGWNIYLLLQSKRATPAEVPSPDTGPKSAVLASSASISSPPCVRCGEPIPEGARFCESCGSPLGISAANPATQALVK